MHEPGAAATFAHLAFCPACQTRLDDIEADVAMLRASLLELPLRLGSAAPTDEGDTERIVRS
jgi:hypothetical protein